MTNAAVLVDLTIRQFGNEKMDKKIAHEVARLHNATRSDDRYLKRILPVEALAGIQSQVSSIRAYHYQVTAPWFDRGIRMIAAAFMIPYQNEINLRKTELLRTVEKVAKDIPMYEAEAMRTRGSLYKVGEMPTPEQFMSRFSVEIEFLPISTEDDFRVEYISNKVKKNYTERNKQRFAQQTEHLISLVEEPLLRLEGSMSNQERAPKIHGTTMDSLNWWCEHIDQLLVDETRQVEFLSMAKEIKDNVTSGYDPDGKPKFDPHAIEGALYSIGRIKETIQCIRA